MKIQQTANTAHHNWPYPHPMDVKNGAVVKAVFDAIDDSAALKEPADASD